MDPIQNLDLSKFPKIVVSSPEEQRIEIERRSAGLTTIREIMENLLNAMQSYLTDLKEIDTKAGMLEQQKLELIEIEKQLHYGQTQLEKKEKELNKQLEYIENWNQSHPN